MVRNRYFRLRVLAPALLVLASSCVWAAADNPCSWQILPPRPVRTDEAPFVARHPLLRKPDDANYAPGPGTLRAVVQKDDQRHPFVHVEDRAIGTSRQLVRGSRPRWSADGKKIACSSWKSLERPWMLCVVDVATGRKTEPELGATTATFEWAPDSKAIAVGGVLYGKPVNVLCIVSVPSGKSQTVDTLAVFSDYELAWSPDSRYLVVPRPTKISHEEEVLEADLWLFDRAGRRCRLTNTPDFVERKPQWIDATRLQYERHRIKGDLSAASEVVVVELR